MRTVLVLALLAALIGLAIAEQVSINRVYGYMLRETDAIIYVVEAHADTYNKEDFRFNDYVKLRVDDLHNYWVKKERKLCIIIKHIDLSYISDALIYAQNFIHFDNKEEAMAGLRRLEYLLNSYHNIYGLNGVNIL